MIDWEKLAREKYARVQRAKTDGDRLRRAVRFGALMELSKGRTPKITADLWGCVRS